jgi:ParB family transcriptional regulator, chromosome partitioning protein
MKNKERISKNMDKTLQKISPSPSDAEDREYKILTYKDSIVLDIPLDNIEIRKQVRTSFNEEKISEMSESIKDRGLSQPISVMKHPTDRDRYIIKFGENRYRAHKLIGAATIKGRVTEYTEDPVEISLAQLDENLQRIDLHPIDTAEAVLLVKKDLGLTLEKMAKKIHRSLSWIKKLSQINNLSLDKKAFLREQEYTFKETMSFIDMPETDVAGLLASENNNDVSAKKRQYETREGIKEMANAVGLKLKIHNKEPEDEVLRKIGICENFIIRARKQLKERKPR